MRWMLAATILMSSPALAQTMNAETFHQRATALKKKGAMAIFSGGEIKALMREGQASGQAAKSRYNADKSAGRATRFCPPPGKQQMDSDEYMERLAAIPLAERRRIDMTEATTRIMAAKFPCRG
jgi:DNA-binding transcriptional regulator LsrR (DeoR family)